MLQYIQQASSFHMEQDLFEADPSLLLQKLVLAAIPREGAHTGIVPSDGDGRPLLTSPGHVNSLRIDPTYRSAR